jgi:hypothetical protein
MQELKNVGINCPKILGFYIDGEHTGKYKIERLIDHRKNTLIQNLFVCSRIHLDLCVGVNVHLNDL